MAKLTEKQKRFVEEYLIDLNATQAAIRAGYSTDSASRIAVELLNKTHVADAIAHAQAKRSERTQVKQDDVVEELACLSFSDIRHYQIDDEGQVQLAPGAPDSAMRAVSSLKRKTRTYVDRATGERVTEHDTELRLWSKPDSLNMLGKHLNMFVERREMSGPDGKPIQVESTLTDEERIGRIVAIVDAARTRGT